MSIQRLNDGTVTTASLFPFYDSANGVDRKASVAALATAMGVGVSPTAPVTQYASPNATGFTVTIAPLVNGGSVYLLLTPTGTFAAGTITLPAQATCVDGQELLVSCTQIVTALTVGGNGATVNGAPTTLAAANAFFRLRFDGVNKAWYRAG